jgi:hypothetical protein
VYSYTERATDIRAAAPDGSTTAHRSAITIERCQAHQSGELFDRDLPQFRESRDEQLCQSGPHARNGLQELRLLLPDRTRLNQGLEVGVERINLAGEPDEMVLQRGVDIDQRLFSAMPLHGPHREKLPAAADQGVESLQILWLRWAGDRLDPLATQGQYGGVQTVGFREEPPSAFANERACRGLTTATAQPWVARVTATARSSPPVASLVISVGESG